MRSYKIRLNCIALLLAILLVRFFSLEASAGLVFSRASAVENTFALNVLSSQKGLRSASISDSLFVANETQESEAKSNFALLSRVAERAQKAREAETRDLADTSLIFGGNTAEREDVLLNRSGSVENLLRFVSYKASARRTFIRAAVLFLLTTFAYTARNLYHPDRVSVLTGITVSLFFILQFVLNQDGIKIS